MSADDASEKRPRVLFVYYSHTQQTQRVCDAMAEVLRKRGCDVTQAGIEFTDPKYSKNSRHSPSGTRSSASCPCSGRSCGARRGKSRSRTK